MESFLKKPLTKTQTDRINNKIIRFLATNYISLRSTESIEFINLLKEIDPNFNPASRKSFRKVLIPAEYRKQK